MVKSQLYYTLNLKIIINSQIGYTVLEKNYQLPNISTLCVKKMVNTQMYKYTLNLKKMVNSQVSILWTWKKMSTAICIYFECEENCQLPNLYTFNLKKIVSSQMHIILNLNIIVNSQFYVLWTWRKWLTPNCIYFELEENRLIPIAYTLNLKKKINCQMCNVWTRMKFIYFLHVSSQCNCKIRTCNFYSCDREIVTFKISSLSSHVTLHVLTTTTTESLNWILTTRTRLRMILVKITVLLR